jgi:hypothetical protein
VQQAARRQVVAAIRRRFITVFRLNEGQKLL